ncbi:hypothetical protein IAR50_006379 [Cryptococcus sp. DSM 104548]
MSLHNICQTIHAHQLVPPTKFLLTSSLPNGDDPDEWRMCLFWMPDGGGEVKVWKADQRISDANMTEAQLVESIQNGMMSIKLKPTSNPSTMDDLYLQMAEPKRWISCFEKDNIDRFIPDLMRATYKLLDPESEGWTSGSANKSSSSNEQNANSNPKPQTPPPRPKTPEPAAAAVPVVDPKYLEMQEQLAQAEAQIRAFNSQQARASQSGPGRASQQSPVKPKAPKNANKLQPTQKRRKKVEDEFAGSDDSD